MNRGQTVVHKYLHPFATPPQPETENAGILVRGREGLVCRHDSVEETLAEVEDPEAGH
jgi:hypothetical protein